MLSQHEQRALADIERQFREDDPELARQLELLRRRRLPRPRLLCRVAGLAALLLGVVLLAAGFAARSDAVAGLAVVVLAIGLAATALYQLFGSKTARR